MARLVQTYLLVLENGMYIPPNYAAFFIPGSVLSSLPPLILTRQAHFRGHPPATVSSMGLTGDTLIKLMTSESNGSRKQRWIEE